MQNFVWKVNYVPSAFVREQRQAGLRLYTPTADQEAKLNKALDAVWGVFTPELLSQLHAPIVGVFAYDGVAGFGDFASSDAICCSSHGGRDFWYFCIGFERRSLDADEDYLQFLVLHEIAHALSDGIGHTPHYEALLDLLLQQFNAATGRQLKNDYVTFNDEAR